MITTTITKLNNDNYKLIKPIYLDMGTEPLLCRNNSSGTGWFVANKEMCITANGDMPQIAINKFIELVVEVYERLAECPAHLLKGNEVKQKDNIESYISHV